MSDYEVLLVVESLHVKDKEAFEKHLKKEGFLAINGEEFAYQGKANLPLMNTRAYIFSVLKKAMELSNTKTCAFICSLGENPLEKYKYDEKIENFNEVIS